MGSLQEPRHFLVNCLRLKDLLEISAAVFYIKSKNAFLTNDSSQVQWENGYYRSFQTFLNTHLQNFSISSSSEKKNIRLIENVNEALTHDDSFINIV